MGVNIEVLSIEQFMAKAMSNPRVTRLIADWRVEPEKLQTMVTGYFRDMGIFHVSPAQVETMIATVVHQLKHSPDVIGLVRAAEKQENQKKKQKSFDL